MNIEVIVTELNSIVEEKGLKYLVDEPYGVFEKLVDSGAANRKVAGAVFHFLVSGVMGTINETCEIAELSEEIQKVCFYNKRMSESLALIFSTLHSPDNKEEWKAMALREIERFKDEMLNLKWKGFAEWDGGSVSVFCHYESELAVMPTEHIVIDDKLDKKLRENPLMTKEEIGDYYRRRLSEYLDYKFDYFCTCEEYYEPVVEEFEIEYHLKDWCDENGFEFISCEGEGYDSGYVTSDERRYLRFG